MSYLFTSESVSEGHPDKVADQISDAVIDAFLTHDSNAKVACETFVTTGLVVIGGEITTTPAAKMCDEKGCSAEQKAYCLSMYGADGKFVGPKCDMNKCMNMSKEECAAYCDSMNCSPEEKAMCVAHAGASKSGCMENCSHGCKTKEECAEKCGDACAKMH